MLEHLKVRIIILVYEKFDLLNNAKRNATHLVVEEIYFMIAKSIFEI